VNSYNDLVTIKDGLDIAAATTSEDTALLFALNAASRLIDDVTGRVYYVQSATRYYDGQSSPWMLADDVLAVTTLKTDEDGDATYENTLAATDYQLNPLNTFPKTWVVIQTVSDYGGFAPGITSGIELVGTFGYGDGSSSTPYTATAINVTVGDATTTTVTVSAEDVLAPGHTILAGAEQMYISAATTDSSNEITVTRGVNGSTAAAHSTATASIYDYPDTIKQAVLIQANRWWKRKDSAFADVIGIPELGTIIAKKGLDPDVKEIVRQYGSRDYY